MQFQKVYCKMQKFVSTFTGLSWSVLSRIYKMNLNISILLSVTTLFIFNRRVYLVIKRVLKDKLTYLDISALIDLYKSTNKLKKGRNGIIIEAGCALGGSALIIATSKEQTRPFYIYDVFEMIPPPSNQDGDDAHERYKTIASGISKGIGRDRYYGYEENLLDGVEKTFRDYGLPPDMNNVYLIKGIFEDSLFVNEPVALAHIDCDWYESVMICLQRIEPYLIKGGVLIIDDYYTWQGCRKAVDTYFANKKDEFKLFKKSRLYIVRTKNKRGSKNKLK